MYKSAFLKPSELKQHIFTTIAGGFMGSYALLLRGGNFGNAQTGNLLEMMIDIAEWNLGDLLVRLGAFFCFAAAIILITGLRHFLRQDLRQTTLIIEALGMILTALIPANAPHLPALYPIFFISTLQWCTFSGAEGFACANIFSTNNLRQAVTGWTEYALSGNPESLKKARVYTLTVLSFMLGGLLGAAASVIFGPIAILGGLVPLLLTALHMPEL